MEISLDKVQTVFIQGVKGVGMANLAVILKKMGKNVIGSDVDEHFITDELLAANDIEVITSFEAKDLPKQIDLYTYSAAHKGTSNPQAVEAKKRGILCIPQTALIGEISKQFTNSIAVCGCHGKTTTSSLLAYALKKLQADPTYYIGTSTFNDLPAGDYEGKEYFVIEADEYGVNPPVDKTPKFLLLHPTHILCMNIDYDHPDVYSSLHETKEAFLAFFCQKNAKLFLCADNTEVMDVAKKIPRERYSTYGFSEKADIKIVNPVINETFSEFDLIQGKNHLGVFQISLFGLHNISNAAAVVALLLSFGYSPEKIKEAIRDFIGAKRRFEKVASVNGIEIFDDYGHHPEEIRWTIITAKKRFKDRRVIAIFQPHTFSRTNILKEEFVHALSHADLAIIAPIFASARENKEENKITSEDLQVIAKEKGVQTIVTYKETSQLLEILKENLRKGDIVFTIGAGDIYKLKNDIIKVAESLS